MNTLTEVQTGWLAGIIEGEGTIEFVTKNSIRIAVVMTDQDVLERLQQVTGVGTVTEAREPSKCANSGRKQQYRWRVGAKEDVEPILRSILPWMGERRGARIEEALGRYDNPTPRIVTGIDHGTLSGLRKERRRGLESCEECLKAERASRKGR